MADMQRPQPTEGAVAESLSIMNPTDIAVMQKNGMLDGNTSIREFFATKGVDVDGPMSQFVEFAKREMQNADPLQKMKKIAGSGGGQPPAPQGAPQGAPSGGGLEQLMGGM